MASSVHSGRSRAAAPPIGIRDLDGFDVLAAVLFDGVYRVVRAALIPGGVVRHRSTYTGHTNSYRFMLRDNVWDAPEVIDATARLRAILQRSDGPPRGAGTPGFGLASC